MWPFDRKRKTENQKSDEPEKESKITFRASDDDITRAINVLKLGGLVINGTAYTSMVPWVARGMKAYHDLDRQAWEGERKARRSGRKKDATIQD